MMNASPAPQEIFLLKLGEVVLKGQNRQSFEAWFLYRPS